jgi:hypothetical protein
MTVTGLWIFGLLDQWIVGGGNSGAPFFCLRGALCASARTANRAATVRERNQPAIPVSESGTAPSWSGLCYSPPIQKSNNPPIQPSELSPTFRLDGGTVPRQKLLWHFQKPLIFRWWPRCKPPKKRTVPFDHLKFAFFHPFFTFFHKFSEIFQTIDDKLRKRRKYGRLSR